jgi:hypothetical protein
MTSLFNLLGRVLECTEKLFNFTISHSFILGSTETWGEREKLICMIAFVLKMVNNFHTNHCQSQWHSEEKKLCNLKIQHEFCIENAILELELILKSSSIIDSKGTTATITYAGENFPPLIRNHQELISDKWANIERKQKQVSCNCEYKW